MSSILSVLSYSILFYLENEGVISVSLNLLFGVSLSIVLINTIVWLLSFSKNVTLNPDFNLNFKKEIVPFFKYILPVFVGLIINFLNYRFDIWLVSYYIGNVQLGIYVLAVNFAQFILLYSKIIGGVMLPYLSEDNDQQRKKYFTTYSRINFTSIILIVCVLAFLGNWLLVFLYGEEFTNSAEPFKILLLGMVFSAMSQLFSIMLFSKGKNNITLIANSVGLIATVFLDVLLIPKYGIIGAAVATASSYFLLFMVLLCYLVVGDKFKIFDLFIIKKDDLSVIFQKD